MATNHVSPEDAMLSHQDTPEKAMARAQMTEEVRRELVLDPDEHTYESSGSVTIEWQRGGEWQSQEIPIQSLGADRAKEIFQKHYIDNSHLPRIKDENGKMVVDSEHPDFEQYAVDVLSEQTEAKYEQFLYGFAGKEIKWKGRVVWSSRDESVRDFDAAIESLKALKIPPTQLSRITSAVEEISMTAEEKKARDLENWGKKSVPSSALPETSTTNGTNPDRPRRKGQRRIP